MWRAVARASYRFLFNHATTGTFAVSASKSGGWRRRTPHALLRDAFGSNGH